MYLVFKRSLYCVLLLNISISIHLFAQANELKRIVPPSPIMAPYLRYGDYPVSHSTGMTQISIPLYEIKVKDFIFPIDISFHASGRRTSYDLSTMGVGWVLNATGFISREIRDRPDELGRYSESMDVSVADISYTNGVYDPLKRYKKLLPADITVERTSEPNTNYYKDAEHDLYSYNVNNISGKFTLDESGNVFPLTATSYRFINPTTIIDEKGVKYEFGITGNEKESTSISHQYSQYSVTTGWYLSKITLPSSEVITFNYGSKYTAVQGDDIEAPYSESYQFSYSNPLRSDANVPYGYAMSNYYSNLADIRQNSMTNTGQEYFIKYLTSIDFGRGKVIFNYNTNNLLLNSMQVLDKNDRQIKNIDFLYVQTPGTSSLFPNNNSKSLVELTINQSDKYKFDYYNNPISSPGDFQSFYRKKDWWGYSNTYGDKIPVTPNPVFDDDIAAALYGCSTCKTPSFYSKLSGMLKKITYPTSGTTEFLYEENMYLNGGTTGGGEIGPGLRIRKITSDDGLGNQLIKSYRYGPLNNGVENGTGLLLYTPKAEDFKSKLTYCVIETQPRDGMTVPKYGGSYLMSYFYKDPVATIAEAYRLPVYYATVTEYTESTTGDKNGKTVYEYSTPDPVFGSSGTVGANSFTTKNWTGSKLYNKTVYKYRPVQNDYVPSQWDHNEYVTLNYKKIPRVRFKRIWILNYTSDNQTSREAWEMLHANLTNISPGKSFGTPYDVIDWPIESAVQMLKKQNVISYDTLGVVSAETETTYSYDNLEHLQPTKTETILSKSNQKAVIETKYAQDFLNLGTSTPFQQGLKKMQSSYIIAPVETSRYISTLTDGSKQLLSSELYAYNPVKPVLDSIFSIEVAKPISDFSPAKVVSGNFISDNKYEKKYVFDGYDEKLNLLQQHKVNGTNSSYIWGYNKEYPIAEVINAAVKDVFYEGFEETTGSDISTTKYKTGRSSKFNSYSKSLTGLTSGKYTLSYWTETNNSWSLVTINDIPVTGSYTINITNSGSYIDEIRFCPAEARMTTYAYQPLVGMITQSDARGQITYYEYDRSGRLITIKDENRNIIKSYNYHFKP